MVEGAKKARRSGASDPVGWLIKKMQRRGGEQEMLNRKFEDVRRQGAGTSTNDAWAPLKAKAEHLWKVLTGDKK